MQLTQRSKVTEKQSTKRKTFDEDLNREVLLHAAAAARTELQLWSCCQCDLDGASGGAPAAAHNKQWGGGLGVGK